MLELLWLSIRLASNVAVVVIAALYGLGYVDLHWTNKARRTVNRVPRG